MQVEVPGYGPVRAANGILERWKGLRGSQAGAALAIPGFSVHGFGMDRPLLVVALTRDFEVMTSVVMLPNRVVSVRGARWMVELPAGVEPPLPGTRLTHG